MTDVTDTRRRASIRGRESVARWRIESGVWSGRLFTVIYAVVAILPLLGGGREQIRWNVAIGFLILAAGLLVATESMKRGSRVAACVLLGLFLALKIASWLLERRPLWSGALWTIIIAGGIANGVWGTFALEVARRDAASVPPAPRRQARLS